MVNLELDAVVARLTEVQARAISKLAIAMYAAMAADEESRDGKAASAAAEADHLLEDAIKSAVPELRRGAMQ